MYICECCPTDFDGDDEAVGRISLHISGLRGAKISFHFPEAERWMSCDSLCRVGLTFFTRLDTANSAFTNFILQHRVVGGTGAHKFTVFLEDDFNGKTGKGYGYKEYGEEDSFHIKWYQWVQR